MQTRRPQCFSFALGLPALALVSLAGATPSLAATQAPTPATTHSTEPVMVANLGNLLRDINSDAQAVQREQERRERKSALQQLRQEWEAAQRELPTGLGPRMLEAERQRQYFESLTPEQRQAYMAEQQACQEIIWWLLGNGGSSGNSSMGDEVDICLRYRIAACRNLD